MEGGGWADTRHDSCSRSPARPAFSPEMVTWLGPSEHRTCVTCHVSCSGHVYSQATSMTVVSPPLPSALVTRHWTFMSSICLVTLGITNTLSSTRHTLDTPATVATFRDPNH